MKVEDLKEQITLTIYIIEYFRAEDGNIHTYMLERLRCLKDSIGLDPEAWANKQFEKASIKKRKALGYDS